MPTGRLKEAAHKVAPAIGICILAYIIVNVGPGKIAAAFLGANPHYILLATVFLLPYVFLQSWKWKTIMENQGIKLPFPYLLRVYLKSIFWSALTPGRLGTFVRVKYVMRKTGRSAGECVSGVVIDKLLDMLALFLLAALGVLALAGQLSVTMLYAVLVLFAIFVASSAFLLKKGLSSGLMKIFYMTLLPKRLKSGAKSAFHSFYSNMPRPAGMIVPFAMTLLSWLSVHTTAYFISLSLGMTVPYYIFVTTFAIATIVSLLPVTINGFGTREAILIALFVPFGIGPETVIAMSIMYSLADVVLSAAGLALMPGRGR